MASSPAPGLSVAEPAHMVKRGLAVTCGGARGLGTWPEHVTEPPSGLRVKPWASGGE